jgi:hypothetical protein
MNESISGIDIRLTLSDFGEREGQKLVARRDAWLYLALVGILL